LKAFKIAGKKYISFDIVVKLLFETGRAIGCMLQNML